MYKKSELGGKSAWKGFTAQTIYIANRLINEKNLYHYYPENKEDLCIKDKDDILEIVQVKNYSEPLKLSHLKPNLKEGFVARSIHELNKNKDITLRIICFGEVGSELSKKDGLNRNEILEKIKNYGYKEQDIELFLNKLIIEKVDEDKLRTNIFDIFESDNKTKFMREILYERLIFHIAYLSRYGGYTSKELWDNKVDTSIESIQELKILEDEYKRTIMQLSDDKFYRNYSYQKLKEEYKLGADARPEHIRKNLDIVREKWMREIDYKLNNNNIIVLKGSSGQGKSSLAYRYLIDNYPENNIYVISNIHDRQHALNLSKAIKGLSKDTANEIIFYIDVNPYEVNWVWLVEEINKINNNIKLLITIRYEDYNRANIKLSRDKFEEIDLEFTKEEAKDIYDYIGSEKFLDFDESWEKFGGEGPFLEYIYLLNENEAIEDRIRTQIKNLMDDPGFEDSWFELLAIIMNLGRYNLSTDIYFLKELVDARNMTKILRDLENEHFIRLVDNGSILGLHSLRSKKILEVILEEIGFINKENLLLDSIKACDENFYILIIEYYYNNKSDNIKKIIIDLIGYTEISWNYYYNILNATLWVDIFNYYIEAKNDMEEIDIDNLPLFFGDMTGLLNMDAINITDKYPEYFSEDFKKIVDKYSNKKVNFNISKFYLEKILSKIEEKEIIKINDLSKISFIIMFMYYLDIGLKKLDIKLEININEKNLDYWLDFIFSLKLHELNYYKEIEENILNQVILNYNFTDIKILDKMIDSTFIMDTYIDEDLNEEIVKRVDVLYRLYPNKEKYKVKEPTIENLEKNIENSNIVKPEIAIMNSWVREIDLYGRRPDTWKEYFLEFKYIRSLYLDIINDLILGIEHVYKTGGDISKLIDTKITNKKWSNYDKKLRKLCIKNLLKPKILYSEFGVNISNSINKEENKEEEVDYKQVKENRSIHDYYISYDRSFKNFFFNRMDLIKKMINQDYNKHKIHISMINLIDSIDKLNIFRSQIKKEKLEKYLIDLDYEFNKLKLLNVYWFNMIDSNRIYKKNSLNYDSKELMKQKKRLIDNIFKEIGKEYTVKYSNCIISIDTVKNNVDTLLQKIYINIRKEFMNKNENIYEYLFFIGYLDYIKINIINDNLIYSSSYKFSIKEIFYSNDF